MIKDWIVLAPAGQSSQSQLTTFLFPRGLYIIPLVKNDIMKG